MAEHYEIRLDTEQLERDAEKARKEFDKIGDEAVKQGRIIDSSFKEIAKSTALIGAGFSANELVSEITRVRGQFQQLEVSFSTILNSEERATKLMSQLVRTAATTPFDLLSVAQGAKQLLAYGESAEKVNEDLIRLGNIAAGLSLPLNDLVYLFGTTMTQGRLYTEDFNQFTSRGIPMVRELAKIFGIAESEVKGFVEAGRVGFPEVQKVIENLTNEGGMFFELMEKQSKTITGQISNIEDAFAMMLNEIGQSNEGVINDALSGVSYLVENYKQIGQTLAEIVVAYGTYKAALVAVSVMNKAHAAVMAQAVVEQRLAAAASIQLSNAQAVAAARTKLLSASVKSLNAALMANPYTLIAATVVALGYGIYKLATYQTDYEKGLKSLNGSISEFNASVMNEQRELLRLKGSLKAAKEGTAEYEAAKEKLIKNYSKYYDGLEEEIEKVGLTEQAYNKLTEAINKSFGARQYDKFRETQRNELDSILTENLEYIQNRLYKELGDEQGGYIYTKIRSALVEGKDINAEITTLLNQIQDKGTIVADSRIDAAIRKIQTAYKSYDALDKLAKERFGIETNILPDTDKTESDGKKINKTLSEIISSITATEQKIIQLRSQAQKGLISTTDVEKAESELDSLKKKYKAMTGSDWLDSGSRNNLTKSLQKIEDLEKESMERRINTIKDLSTEIERVRLDLMNEGSDKIKAQQEQSNKEEIEALKKRRDEYVKAEIEAQKKIFEAQQERLAEKNKGYEIKIFEPGKVNIDTSMFDSLIDLTLEAQKKKQREAEEQSMIEYLAEYGDYWEKRKAIAEKYAREIDKATTEGEKLSLQAAAKEMLAKLDDEAQAKTSAISKLFGNMSMKSVEEMRKIADEAENLLSFIEAGEYQTDNAFGITKEQFDILVKSPEKLESIKNEINNVRKEANRLEPTFDKVKRLLVDIFSGSDKDKLTAQIQELNSEVSKVLNSISFLSDAFSNLGDAFGGDVFSGIADGLNAAMGAVNSALQGAQAGSMFGPIGAAAGAAIGAVTSLASSIAKIHDKKNEREIERLQDQIDALSSSYDNLGRATEDAYSTDASNLIEQQNKLLEKQKVLIQAQIREEQNKKKTDESRIKDWEQQLEDIDIQLEENKEKAIDAIFGEDIKTAIENFATATTDAWAQQANASQSAKDVVKKMMQQMVTESIKATLQSSKSIEEIRKKMQEFYADEVFSDWEKDYLYDMADRVQQELNNKFGWAQDLFQEGSEPYKQSATTGTSITASQESVDELSGRFTAVQMAAEEIKLDVKIGNVSLESIRNTTNEVRDIVQSCYGELIEIKENTAAIIKPIQQMQKDITEVKNNTSRL